jgi:hypothetical protein
VPINDHVKRVFAWFIEDDSDISYDRRARGSPWNLGIEGGSKLSVFGQAGALPARLCVFKPNSVTPAYIVG